jgi:hypothetical protein
MEPRAMQTRLTDAPREFQLRYGKAFAYSRFYRLILDARIAATRDGKYYSIDLEEAAKVLGLLEPATI